MVRDINLKCIIYSVNAMNWLLIEVKHDFVTGDKYKSAMDYLLIEVISQV